MANFFFFSPLTHKRRDPRFFFSLIHWRNSVCSNQVVRPAWMRSANGVRPKQKKEADRVRFLRKSFLFPNAAPHTRTGDREKEDNIKKKSNDFKEANYTQKGVVIFSRDKGRPHIKKKEKTRVDAEDASSSHGSASRPWRRSSSSSSSSSGAKQKRSAMRAPAMTFSPAAA